MQNTITDPTLHFVVSTVVVAASIVMWFAWPKLRWVVAASAILSAADSVANLIWDNPQTTAFYATQAAWIAVGIAAGVWMLTRPAVANFRTAAQWWPSAWRMVYEGIRWVLSGARPQTYEHRFSGRIVAVERNVAYHDKYCGDLIRCVRFTVEADVTTSVTDHRGDRTFPPARNRKIVVRAPFQEAHGADPCIVAAYDLDFRFAKQATISGKIVGSTASGIDDDEFIIVGDDTPDMQVIYGTLTS